MKTKLIALTALASLSFTSFAEEKAVEEVQDMSDPLAVYTQAGVGTTNRGVNIKIGQSYDTGVDTTSAMRLIELKGFLGDSLGWDDGGTIDNAMDSVRFRNFSVNTENGRGTQIDLSYNLDGNNLAEDTGEASYSILQSLPAMGPVSLFPLLGAGLAFGTNAIEDDGSVDSGFSMYGVYGMVGLYSKIKITDKIWVNYNPFYLSAFSGSDNYKENAYGQGNDSVVLHEASVSYQFTPRFNVRYFANWTQYNNFGDGEHRIEVNYQL